MVCGSCELRILTLYDVLICSTSTDETLSGRLYVLEDQFHETCQELNLSMGSTVIKFISRLKFAFPENCAM